MKIQDLQIPENVSKTGSKLRRAEYKNRLRLGDPDWPGLIDAVTAKKNEDVTPAELNTLERVVDNAFGKLGIDVEFTRHFLDRANDSRNGEPITVQELAQLFAKEYKRWGKPIAQLGPDAEAVMKDLESDINIPFVLRWNGKELEMIAKTVMRKKNFRTSNKEFPVESKLDEYAFLGPVIAAAGQILRKQGIKVARSVIQKAAEMMPSGVGPDAVAQTVLKGVAAGNAVGAAVKGQTNELWAGRPSSAPKRTTIKKKKEKFDEPSSVRDRLIARRQAAAKGDKNAFRADKYTATESVLTEDMPPLAELIVLAVVMKTTVKALIPAIKLAYRTGKGMNQLRKAANNAGIKLSDRILGDTTKSEIIADIKNKQLQRFYDAALNALDKLVKNDKRGQTVDGYAFDIARAFNGIDRRQLTSMYNKLNEAWSKKYKKSINCNNPKGFSQKAHCAGRKKNEDAAFVAGKATQSNAINLDKTVMIGTYGREDGNKALIRFPDGNRFMVNVGDHINGMRITDIGDGTVDFTTNGNSYRFNGAGSTAVSSNGSWSRPATSVRPQLRPGTVTTPKAHHFDRIPMPKYDPRYKDNKKAKQ